MLPMNQLPMLSQDEYNDFIEFQNFKKLKYVQQQQQRARIPSGLNLSGAADSSAATAAAFNFFNNPNGNSALNSIFPMSTSASIPPTSMAMSMSMLAANQSFLNHERQQKESQPITPKMAPNGIPLQLMRPPSAASFIPSPNMFATIPPSMPIHSLTPKAATLNSPDNPRGSISPLLPTTPSIRPQTQKRRARSPEIKVNDGEENDAQNSEKKTKLQKVMPELYTTKTESCLPKLYLKSALENSSYQQIASPLSNIPPIEAIRSQLLQCSTKQTATNPNSNKLLLQRQSHSTPKSSESFVYTEEIHKNITARPTVSHSAKRNETDTSEDDSDNDTNLRPGETPLKYKERMMVRIMDRAKKRCEASKRLRNQTSQQRIPCRQKYSWPKKRRAASPKIATEDPSKYNENTVAGKKTKFDKCHDEYTEKSTTTETIKPPMSMQQTLDFLRRSMPTNTKNVLTSINPQQEGYNVNATDRNFLNELCPSVPNRTTSFRATPRKAPEESHNRSYFIPRQRDSFNTDLNAIGIDFGTTECCAAVICKNGPDFVVLDGTTSSRTMPSYVAFDEEKPKCGQIVVERMRHKSKYSVFDVKRLLGISYENVAEDSVWPFKITNGTGFSDNQAMVEVDTFYGKETKSVEEISAVLLNHIKRVAESHQNNNFKDVVLTIPSKFSKNQQQALERAAKLAGWKTIHFVPEPVAAALAYFSKLNIPNGSNILICDFGGGTMDVCVAKILDDTLQILSCHGDSYLGGRDFDNILFMHFRAILKYKFDIDVVKIQKQYILKQKCQGIKHTLSTSEECWLEVDDYDSRCAERIPITKSEFDEISLPLLVRMKDVTHRAITKADIPATSINYVFQVGGGCRMPMIKKCLVDLFPHSNHQCRLYPNGTVALGAALYCYHLLSNKTETSAPH